MTADQSRTGCPCLIHLEDTAAPTTSFETVAERLDWADALGVTLIGDAVSLADAYRLREQINTEALARFMAEVARSAQVEAEEQARSAHADTNGVCPHAATPRDRSAWTDRERRSWLAARNARAASQ